MTGCRVHASLPVTHTHTVTRTHTQTHVLSLDMLFEGWEDIS